MYKRIMRVTMITMMGLSLSAQNKENEDKLDSQVNKAFMPEDYKSNPYLKPRTRSLPDEILNKSETYTASKKKKKAKGDERRARQQKKDPAEDALSTESQKAKTAKKKKTSVQKAIRKAKENSSTPGVDLTAAIKLDQTLIQIGPLGILVQLHKNDKDQKINQLRVAIVEKKGPSAGILKPGNIIVSAEGKKFNTYYKGFDTLYVYGPAGDLADVIDQEEGNDGIVTLQLKDRTVNINVKKQGSFSKTYPFNCSKSRKLLDQACNYIVAHQQPDGSFGKGASWEKGGSIFTTALCGLAILAHPDRAKYDKAIKKFADFTLTKSDSIAAIGNTVTVAMAGVFYSEYYMQYKDPRFKPVIKQIFKKMLDGQQPYGGWGHGFLGGTYGRSGFGYATSFSLATVGDMYKTGLVDLKADRKRQMQDHLRIITKGGATYYHGQWGHLDFTKPQYTIPGKDERVKAIAAGFKKASARTACSLLGIKMLGDANRLIPSIIAYFAEPLNWPNFPIPHRTTATPVMFTLVGLSDFDPQAFRYCMDYFKRYFIMGTRDDGRLCMGSTGSVTEPDGGKFFGPLSPHACMALLYALPYGQLEIFRSGKYQVKPTKERGQLLAAWTKYIIEPTKYARPPKFVWQLDPPLAPNTVNALLQYGITYEEAKKLWLDRQKRLTKKQMKKEEKKHKYYEIFKITGTIYAKSRNFIILKDKEDKMWWFRMSRGTKTSPTVLIGERKISFESLYQVKGFGMKVPPLGEPPLQAEAIHYMLLKGLGVGNVITTDATILNRLRDDDFRYAKVDKIAPQNSNVTLKLLKVNMKKSSGKKEAKALQQEERKLVWKTAFNAAYKKANEAGQKDKATSISKAVADAKAEAFDKLIGAKTQHQEFKIMAAVYKDMAEEIITETQNTRLSEEAIFNINVAMKKAVEAYRKKLNKPYYGFSGSKKKKKKKGNK